MIALAKIILFETLFSIYVDKTLEAIDYISSIIDWLGKSIPCIAIKFWTRSKWWANKVLSLTLVDFYKKLFIWMAIPSLIREYTFKATTLSHFKM